MLSRRTEVHVRAKYTLHFTATGSLPHEHNRLKQETDYRALHTHEKLFLLSVYFNQIIKALCLKWA